MSRLIRTASIDETEGRQRYISRLFVMSAFMLVLIGLGALAVASASAEGAVGVQKGAGKGVQPEAPSCAPNWQVVSSANQAVTYRTYLRATDGKVPNDMWAVGYAETGGTSQAIIEHWDGTAWSVAFGQQGYVNSAFYGVAALAANDVWAVGYSKSNTIGVAERTYIVHWDGMAWTNVSSPNIGNGGNFLKSVQSIYANNVWAVGYYASAGSYWTLTMRWNGTNWSTVTSPNMGTMSKLEGVAVASSSNIWAVGRYFSGAISHALIMRWTGAAWSTVSYNSAYSTYLYGITALSPTDMWAVGYREGCSTSGYSCTVMIHWNGSQWITLSDTIEDNPGYTNGLYSVRATSATSVWAVGYYNLNSTFYSLVLRWDGLGWHRVTSPNASGNNVLYGVGASGLSNVWAVGDHGAADGVIEKWNGSQWSLYANPGVDVSGSTLTAVDSISSSDAWAVGNSWANMTHTVLLERWNGSAWSVVPAPAPAGMSYLWGVAQIASNDAWAVGTYSSSSSSYTLAMHWDGAAWTSVNTPNVGQTGSLLFGVYALNSSNVWAVGYYVDDATHLLHNLILFWNGSVWSVVPSPNVGTSGNSLASISGSSATDVWAVGSYSAGNTLRTLTLRWNGSTWAAVSSPNGGSATNSNNLSSVTALTPTDAWAVGSYMTDTGFNTVAMHWDGTAWSLVASPNTLSEISRLQSVDKVSATDIWAVGKSRENFVEHTLVEHWDGTAWSIVTSPNVGAKSNSLMGVTVASPTDVIAVGGYDTTVNSQTLVERYNPCN